MHELLKGDYKNNGHLGSLDFTIGHEKSKLTVALPLRIKEIMQIKGLLRFIQNETTISKHKNLEYLIQNATQEINK